MKKFNAEKFSNDFIDIVETLADALEIDPVVFIENIVISRLAADRADDDVYQGGVNLMPEFLQHDGKMLRGRELYKMLYNMKRKELENKRVQQIQDKLQYIDYDQLQEDEKELMKRYKMDPESKEEQQQDEIDIQALIDSGELGEVKTSWNGEEPE